MRLVLLMSLGALCLSTTACVLDRTGQSASALYLTEVSDQRVRMSNLESQFEAMDSRVGQIEEYNRSRGQSEILKMENLEQLREELARMRGEIEILQHEFDQTSLQELGRAADTDFRILWLEDRAENLEKQLGLTPPAPPEVSASPSEPMGVPSTGGGTAEAEVATGEVGEGVENTEGSVPAPNSGPPAGATEELETVDPVTLIRLAEGHLEKGKEEQARTALDRFLQLYPDHARVPQAYYRKAESYFNESDYNKAANGFKLVTERYRESKWAPYAMLRQGECFEAMERPQDAIAFYRALIQLWPKSRAARDAKQKIQALEK